MIELNPTQRRALRAGAHHLSPVASLGQQGLTEAVIKEIDHALSAHALIKVKLHGIERENRDAILTEICTKLDCAPVQHIGNMFILWREKPVELVKVATTKPASVRRPVSKPKTKKQAAALAERQARAKRG